MQLLVIDDANKTGGCARVDDLEALPQSGFVWLDVRVDEPGEPWRELVEDLTGVRIHDAHMTDAANDAHPSFFDNTATYEMIVFRGLVPQIESTDTSHEDRTVILTPEQSKSIFESVMSHKTKPAPINTAPRRVVTHPVTFFLIERMLVTVRPAESPSIGTVRQRLLSNAAKPPHSPADLAHRILNAMVDRYLELRQPLTDRLDRLQRNLLDPRRPFNDWYALLEQRIEIRKLEHLCEEQRDAIAEWSDALNEKPAEQRSEVVRVRIHDLAEHITRVHNHAARLEATAESAVQLHFSAMANRTSEIMRTLTILTAIFMPLTLISGIFGMNFKAMPLVENPDGFWLTLGAMALVVVVLLIYFRNKRYIETREERGVPRK